MTHDVIDFPKELTNKETEPSQQIELELPEQLVVDDSKPTRYIERREYPEDDLSTLFDEIVEKIVTTEQIAFQNIPLSSAEIAIVIKSIHNTKGLIKALRLV